jgi:hypothetical protein
MQICRMHILSLIGIMFTFCIFFFLFLWIKNIYLYIYIFIYLYPKFSLSLLLSTLKYCVLSYISMYICHSPFGFLHCCYLQIMYLCVVQSILISLFCIKFVPCSISQYSNCVSSFNLPYFPSYQDKSLSFVIIMF